jgi:hypothetical protein
MVRYTGRMLESWQPGDLRDVHVDSMALTLRIAAGPTPTRAPAMDICRCTKGHDASTRISAPTSGWLTTGRGPELPGETALGLPVHAAR